MAGGKEGRSAKRELTQLNSDIESRVNRLEEALLGEVESFGGEIRSQTTTTLQLLAHMGPLPPPEILQGYETALPGAADRIISMAEAQQRHRHELEKEAIKSGVARSKQGLAAGFTVTVLFLVASAWLIAGGHETAGTIIGSVDLVALVSLFVIGQKSQSQERAEKRAARKAVSGG